MLLLIAVLMLSKFPFIFNDAVTPLKLMERGLEREFVGLTVLLDFPFQLLIGYKAAQYARGRRPLLPVRPVSKPWALTPRAHCLTMLARAL